MFGGVNTLVLPPGGGGGGDEYTGCDGGAAVWGAVVEGADAQLSVSVLVAFAAPDVAFKVTLEPLVGAVYVVLNVPLVVVFVVALMVPLDGIS